jgi:N-acetylated-alpha-linked acidic dipeptidase
MPIASSGARHQTRALLALAVALATVPVPLSAQRPSRGAPLPGYSAERSAAQRALETRAIASPSPSRAREHSKALSAETHVAGTPAQERTRDYVIAQMRAMGLETEVRSYSVFLPHPTAVQVTRVAPTMKALSLEEPPVAGDTTSTLAQYLTVNGYSGVGDVTADVVYVNYGLIEDYAQLDSLGIDVRGKIAIARYGRSFRGIKAREAEKHGAVALLLYSDPQGDGYVLGDVYPEGPMRNRHGVQRGSVFNGSGDPATPGYASTTSAPRLPIERMEIPRIPVVPLSYGNAAELLEGVRGGRLPAGWQGGLPFRYHVGPGPVRARVRVTDDRATRGTKSIFNTFGIVRGSELPEELVIIGAHRDGWGPGAGDNVSGVVSVLEAARAVAEAVRAGHRPRRTIVFATWDAEEWGLIGSTEYVEDDSLRLMRGAVAYLNQDVAAQGPRFSAGGSPSLRAMLRDVARTVPDPGGRGSVYAEWMRATATPDTGAPAMGDPGGGSDFAWMSRFGDSSFAYHAAAARIGAAMVLRLANADVVPYDYVEFARTMRRYLPALERSLAARRWTGSIQPLRDAIGRMESEALRFSAARDGSLGATAPTAANTRARTAANAALRDVERALTRPTGLRTRAWYRNLIYAADEDNGYSNMVFPSVNEAVRRGDERLTSDELADLARRFDTAARALARARASTP